MANSVLGNKIYIDSTGEITTKKVKVAGILFTPDAADDQIILRETSGGADCLKIRGSVAKQSEFYDFGLVPLVFNNGLYVQTLTTGATATIVTTMSGKD